MLIMLLQIKLGLLKWKIAIVEIKQQTLSQSDVILSLNWIL